MDVEGSALVLVCVRRNSGPPSEHIPRSLDRAKAISAYFDPYSVTRACLHRDAVVVHAGVISSAGWEGAKRSQSSAGER